MNVWKLDIQALFFQLNVDFDDNINFLPSHNSCIESKHTQPIMQRSFP